MDHAGRHEVIHWLAAIVLVVGGAAFILAAARERRSPDRHEPHPESGEGSDRARPIPAIVAATSAGAAAIHLVAAPSHYIELGDLGAGFLAAAVFQATWAWAALGGLTSRIATTGIIVNGAIVAAWAWSRVVGLGAVAPEPVGLPDAAATTFELVLIIVIGAASLARRRGWTSVRARAIGSVAVVPVLGVVVVMTSLAAIAIAAGAEHGTTGGSVHAMDHRAADGIATP